MGKKVKNKDLATRLGLSGTLVSLVLNNKADQQGIKKDTQEKVLSLARQMGYFESLHEKNELSPVEEKPGLIGMIVPSVIDPYISKLSYHLQIVFSEIGVGFSIITKDPDDQRYDRLISSFRKFYSGLILMGSAADENTIRTLRTVDYPFILLEQNIKNLRLNTVCSDSKAGAKMIAGHILKLGYKSVIIVSDKGSMYEYISDLQNIKDAFDQNINHIKPVVVEVDYTYGEEETDFSAIDKYLRPPYRADVMIIMKANHVYSIMKLLKKRGIRIPQDIALVSMEEGIGFDLMYSPVTCLRKSVSGIASKAASMIWSEIRNSGKGKFKRQVSIPPEFILRNSCGGS